MSEIGFYHLTRSSLTQALPQLLARTLAAGQRALVLCGTDDRVAALDRALLRGQRAAEQLRQRLVRVGARQVVESDLRHAGPRHPS